ncbi:glutaredoxin [Armillaria luteobubalina]|uniref:Glutaredoxin n=1 Tax=Armillaria luteobubalina TaxID=153913 RepID=A0AA39Q3G0_9AGAR|nr:glutaredoxin [Armillaria luteobubalina]
MANYHQVVSPSHFQELLSADLTRVSLINFWADFAEPCKQMNEVVLELSKKYPAVLFLQVEAESQQDIAESFDIDAVPSFVILRVRIRVIPYWTRISGANAQALTAAIARHAASPSIHPLSKTDLAPAKAADIVSEKKETEEELEKRMRGLMTKSKVVLFMKGSPDAPRCGFSRRITGLLKDQNVEYSHFDILSDEDVRQGLKKLNDWPTFPQLIINGEFVGGLDIVQEMIDNGEFAEAIA